MRDKLKLAVTLALILGYIAGWLTIIMFTATWMAIVAWVLAVFATSTVVAAVIESGHRDEKLAHRREMEAARRRVAEYGAGWRLEKQKRVDAEKALRVAGKVRR